MKPLAFNVFYFRYNKVYLGKYNGLGNNEITTPLKKTHPLHIQGNTYLRRHDITQLISYKK